jgi:integrase
MRHASIQTTMNIYGKAMTDGKRQAHSKVVQMVLNGKRPIALPTEEAPAAAIGS